MSSASETNKIKAQKLFQFGNEAALKQNLDYAIEMYQQSCKLEPENLLYRQALRAVEKKKLGNDPAKVGRLAAAKNQAILFRTRSPKSKGNFAQVLEICEEAFVNHPWDVSVSRVAAEAAEQLGLNSLAQWLVESVQNQASETDFFIFAAHIHKLNNSFPKAIQCWEKVKKLDPSNQIANREINALSAAATIHKSGIGDAIDERDAKKEQVANELEDLKVQSLSPEERYLKELQEDPKRVFTYLQLADHYKMRGQLDEAYKVLEKGLKAVPGNADLQFALAEVQIARVNAAIDKCKRRLKENPGDEKAKSKLAEFSKMLVDFEIKEFQRRTKVDTQDMNLQLELGIRLAQVGRHDEAIAAFQQAGSSAPIKVKALYNTGLSFEAMGRFKLAERMLLDALKGLESTKDPAMSLAINYRLGRVSEEQGNTQAAEEFYNEVAAIDYSYLDVAERLRVLGT